MPKAEEPKHTKTTRQVDWSPCNLTHRNCYPSDGQYQDRADFRYIREDLADDILNEIDQRVRGGAVAAATHDAGGIDIQLTSKFRNKAGTVQSSDINSKTRIKDLGYLNIANRQQYRATIRLGSKVITNKKRLWMVLAHEYCHLAVKIIDGVKEKHGSTFKKWGRRCEAAFPEQGFAVTTYHKFEIEYRYRWACAGMKNREIAWEENDDGSWTHHGSGGSGMVYGRHSRSVVPGRHTCGGCGVKLVQIMPTPVSHSRTAWRDFQKASFETAKKHLQRLGVVDIGMVEDAMMADFIAPPDVMDRALMVDHHNFNALRDRDDQDDEPREYDADVEKRRLVLVKHLLDELEWAAKRGGGKRRKKGVGDREEYGEG
ncbi:HMG box-containing protein [Elsinoe fawcettii]|nr:HMG box-containing protein [Elsinoe fawcettii]